MRRIALLFALLAVSSANAQTPPGFEAAKNPPPTSWSGPVFKPSFSFPTALPINEPRPWMGIDFKTQPREYLEAVLDYVFEGQDTSSWRLQDNSKRKWFHVPWMTQHGHGREFVHGLTRERSSRPGELGPSHTRCVQNWAVGFYNPLGGYTLGKVFGDGNRPPNPDHVQFPVGTVVAKLLLTEADSEQTSIVTGAPEWEANVNASFPTDSRGCALDSNPRTIKKLRLLQFDIGVRDSRADSTTGWVFGTFVYDQKSSHTDRWRRLKPIGLMWGNDPMLTDADSANGKKPIEGVVLHNAGLQRHFGRGGRMNGPVDNPASSCLSCHSTAMVPQRVGMTPSRRSKWPLASCWFRNLKPTDIFGRPPTESRPCGSDTSGMKSLDYSLQLSRAFINYAAALPSIDRTGSTSGTIKNLSSDLQSLRNARPDDDILYDVTRE